MKIFDPHFRKSLKYICLEQETVVKQSLYTVLCILKKRVSLDIFIPMEEDQTDKNRGKKSSSVKRLGNV